MQSVALLLKPVDVGRAIRGVEDEQHLELVQDIGDDVVEDAPVGSADDRVGRVAGADARQITRAALLRQGERICAA